MMDKYIQHLSGSGAPMRVVGETVDSFTVADVKSGLHYELRRQAYAVVPEPAQDSTMYGAGYEKPPEPIAPVKPVVNPIIDFFRR
jgi:hypothetical protein